MSRDYNHKDIEKKWQKRWEESGIYKADDASKKPKHYVLDMFPYPSGEGLHVGHPKGYVATDIYSRFKRVNGFNVLHPMGWDAFGLPAENFAIKHKVHPRAAVEKNVAYFKQQLSNIGFSYDWSREINTTDPAFYKWTQWIFLKLLEKGLAYESHEPINWCPSCQTGLANEDLNADGTCERCDSKVEKKPIRQWVLKITDYADRMLEDLETLPEWPEHIKEAQRNWIGRSEGAEVDFEIVGHDKNITVFTTRPDTLFGATYVVLAPEHELIQELASELENKEEVFAYIESARKKDDIQRTAEGKEKTGIELKGVRAINPATKEEVPVFIADYVLVHYGTGAIMAVPAHDQRDYEFAKKYNLQIRQVVVPCSEDVNNPPQKGYEEVKRETVIVHLRDTQTGKYALLNWHDSLEGITTAIMGGVEEGQTPEEAALMEIEEEAALVGVNIVHRSPFITSAKYCASHKKENRCAHAHVLLAEVDGVTTQGSIADGEKKKHTLVWVDESEVESLLTPAHQKQVWSLLRNESPLSGDGYLINSGIFDDKDSQESKTEIVQFVSGRMTNTYKIQDWVFSRQRYWGEPIPVIHCEKCGVVPVPEDQLPVTLPEIDHYEPTGTGESPLANIAEWVNVPCPKCDGAAKRETNTMPQWAGSSWYWLRFMDPHNDSALVSEEQEKQWGPVDVYVGGDHAVRHLIYARFWHKFLYDIGVTTTVEPFTRLEFLGFILAEDGRKMSKRWGNIINPDDVVDVHGADAFRAYEMFMGPFENTVPWSTNGLIGVQRFIERVWRLQAKIKDADVEDVETPLHQTIKKVTEDIEAFKFNTAVSQMMIFINHVEKVGEIGKGQYETFIQLLAPFAPHITEELWELLGHTTSIHTEPWPVYDEEKALSQEVTVTVQIAGKMRGTVVVPHNAEQSKVEEMVQNEAKLSKYLDFKPSKVIFVPNKIINFIP